MNCRIWILKLGIILAGLAGGCSTSSGPAVDAGLKDSARSDQFGVDLGQGRLTVSSVVLQAVPFGIHAAAGQHDKSIEIGVGIARKIVRPYVWDLELPDLTDPSDPRLDPAKPWDLDDPKWGTPSEYDVMITLRAESVYWGNSAVNEAVKSGALNGIGLTGFPDRPGVWLKLVNKLVERFDGDGIHDHPNLERPIHIWQIENEFLWQWVGDPDDVQDAVDLKNNEARAAERLASYVTLLEQTAKVIRDQDPAAVIVSGAFTGIEPITFASGRTPESVTEISLGPGGEALEGCAQDPEASPPPDSTATREEFSTLERVGKWQAMVNTAISHVAPHVDWFDYHHYGDDYRFEQPMMAEMTAMISAAGHSKALISAENAGPFFFYTIERQASSLVKRYLMFIEGGGRHLFWSSMNPTTEWNLNFQNLSLLDCDGQPKAPPYYAYRELSSRLTLGATLTRYALPASPAATLFAVTPADEQEPTTFFAWSFDGQQISIIPAELLASSEEMLVRVARISTASSSGLSFELVDATQPLELGEEVLVLETMP